MCGSKAWKRSRSHLTILHLLPVVHMPPNYSLASDDVVALVAQNGGATEEAEMVHISLLVSGEGAKDCEVGQLRRPR